MENNLAASKKIGKQVIIIHYKVAPNNTRSSRNDLTIIIQSVG